MSLVKRTVRVHKKDLETVTSYYPDIGYNKIIRHMLSRLAERIRQSRTKSVIDEAIDSIGEIPDD